MLGLKEGQSKGWEMRNSKKAHMKGSNVTPSPEQLLPLTDAPMPTDGDGEEWKADRPQNFQETLKPILV